MILIVCVDDRYGMQFNKRRQSRDSAVIEKILELSDGRKLWMNSYSRPLFPADTLVCVSDDFLDNAGEGDVCFAENCDLTVYLDRADRIILFRWNRSYPGDLFFPKAVLDEKRLLQVLDFSGTSHKDITMEVYGK